MALMRLIGFSTIGGEAGMATAPAPPLPEGDASTQG
jgi:hypothetical protein